MPSWREELQLGILENGSGVASALVDGTLANPYWEK
jgi:hypothetical protein